MILNFGWSADTTQYWKACIFAVSFQQKIVYANAMQYVETPGTNSYTTVLTQSGLSSLVFYTYKGTAQWKGEVFWIAIGY